MKGADNLSRKVTPAIIKELEDAIGKENVNTSDMERMLYGHDLAPLPKETTLAWKNIPDVVVRPASTEDVSKAVKVAYKYGVAITPRGNATWGLGGAMPAFGGIMIDVSSLMNEVIEINEEHLYVKAGAGATWKNVYDACMKKGLLLGSYPSSFPSATLGGWISTGGIGIGGYKYGSAKDNIRNLKVVMPDGNIVDTGFDKVSDNMSGYNLNQLITGAEGTLGIVTEVTLKLQPAGVIRPKAYEFERFEDLHGPIQDITRSDIKALHIAWSDHLHFENQRKAGLHAPNVKNLLLVTLQGDERIVDVEEQMLNEIVEGHGGRPVSDDIAVHEWDERCYEFRAREVGVGAIPAEVVVPTVNFGEFATLCYDAFKDLKMQAGGIIGMVADRNTCMFMPYYFMDTEALTGMTAYSYNVRMAEESYKFGGRPLGFGIFFATNLPKIRGTGVEVMKDIKTALDPHDVMNPGHLTASKTRFGLKIGEGLMGMGFKVMGVGKKLLPKDKMFDEQVDKFELEKIKREAKGKH